MENSGAHPPPPLELREVTKFFGDFRAVDGVSFTLPSGSIYGFLGPNGAGKTTIIRMILDILKPTRGEIRVLGHDSALKVRQRIGYLPEEKGLYKKMKCWAVIAYFATLKGLSRGAARRRAFDLLEQHGLKDFACRPTETLSKGMGQKVQLLASIAHDPEFVVLDEPFSGLDPVNQQVMEEVIRDLARRGRTVLFSTHVMQHAERLCDRILLLSQGRKIFDGTVTAAKRTLPRRVRIETEDDIAPLRGLPEVITVREVKSAPDSIASAAAAREVTARGWELEVREDANPQAILQACFARGIRLLSFDQSEPTLHEVFMWLVGPEAKEVAFR